ncbi:MAG: DUF5709 domain-containing protein [Actinomycetes bacterium]
MGRHGWYDDEGEGGKDETYDPAYGPTPVDPDAGRVVEEDEGAHPDVTSEAVAHLAAGDVHGLSAEESAVHVLDEEALVEQENLDLLDTDGMDPSDGADRGEDHLPG